MLSAVIAASLWLASEQSPPTVTLGVLVFPPEVVINPDTGECEGNAIKKVRELLSPFIVKAECAPPARIFKMIEHGEVDLTINIKSTPAVKDFVEFVDPAYRYLTLNLYGHQGFDTPGTVAAIRGFDYHGYRTNLTNQDFIFVDLPTSIDAISMFTRQRTDYLLSYESPAKALRAYFPDDTRTQTLMKVPTHLAISKVSPYRMQLIKHLNNLYQTQKFETFERYTVE